MAGCDGSEFELCIGQVGKGRAQLLSNDGRWGLSFVSELKEQIWSHGLLPRN